MCVKKIQKRLKGKKMSADGSSQSFGGLTAQIGWFALRVGGHPALSLHSSNKLGELSQ